MLFLELLSDILLESHLSPEFCLTEGGAGVIQIPFLLETSVRDKQVLFGRIPNFLIRLALQDSGAGEIVLSCLKPPNAVCLFLAKVLDYKAPD